MLLTGVPVPVAASGAHVENGSLSKTPIEEGVPTALVSSPTFFKKMKFEAM